MTKESREPTVLKQGEGRTSWEQQPVVATAVIVLLVVVGVAGGGWRFYRDTSGQRMASVAAGAHLFPAAHGHVAMCAKAG